MPSRVQGSSASSAAGRSTAPAAVAPRSSHPAAGRSRRAAASAPQASAVPATSVGCRPVRPESPAVKRLVVGASRATEPASSTAPAPRAAASRAAVRPGAASPGALTRWSAAAKPPSSAR